MTTSTLVYSTDNPPAFEEEEEMVSWGGSDGICLGSQGIISTSSCNRVSEMVHGRPCEVCCL